MTPAAGIALAVGGGGLLYLAVRALAKRNAPQSDAPANDPCASLSGDAKTACEVATSAWDIVNSIATNKSADNVKLNGAITERVPADFQAVYPCWADEQGDCGFDLNTGRTNAIDNAPASHLDLRYENGCVPYAGHPDFAKCAPGTADLTNHDAPHPVDLSAIDTAGPGDLLTFVWSQNKAAQLAARADFFGKPAPTFPKTCAAGETRAFVQGKAVCLPSCADPLIPIGHIDLAHKCIGNILNTTYAGAGGGDSTPVVTAGHTSVVSPTGLVWVPFPVGHWEHPHAT